MRCEVGVVACSELSIGNCGLCQAAMCEAHVVTSEGSVLCSACTVLRADLGTPTRDIDAAVLAKWLESHPHALDLSLAQRSGLERRARGLSLIGSVGWTPDRGWPTTRADLELDAESGAEPGAEPDEEADD